MTESPTEHQGSLGVAQQPFFLVFLELCIDTSYQEYAMKERGQCTPGVCPGATANGQTVSIYVDHNHPLLQLQRALPWEALTR